MTEGSEAVSHAREALGRLLPSVLPSDARAVTVEVSSWLVTVRVYCHGPIADLDYDGLETQVSSVIAGLPSRVGEPWQFTVQLARQDEPQPLDVFGTPVWVRAGTRVGTVDLKTP